MSRLTLSKKICRKLIDRAPVVRTAYQTAKRSYLLARRGRFTTDQLLADISSHIGDSFQVLMVHSAADRLLPLFTGTPAEIVKGLGELCGQQRTLAMPAFFFGPIVGFDPIGYYRANPHFHELKTPSHTGIICEIFRRNPNTLRSLHPMHSVCAQGPHAQDIVGTHHLSKLAFDKFSPFCAMARLDTIILGIAIPDMESLTHVHTAESLLKDQFPIKFDYSEVTVQMTTRQGNSFPYKLCFPFTDIPRSTSKLREILTPDELLEWNFHGIPFFAVRAKTLTFKLCQAARAGWTIYHDKVQGLAPGAP